MAHGDQLVAIFLVLAHSLLISNETALFREIVDDSFSFFMSIAGVLDHDCRSYGEVDKDDAKSVVQRVQLTFMALCLVGCCSDVEEAAECFIIGDLNTVARAENRHPVLRKMSMK